LVPVPQFAHCGNLAGGDLECGKHVVVPCLT
jgi:hypothetical protein